MRDLKPYFAVNMQGFIQCYAMAKSRPKTDCIVTVPSIQDEILNGAKIVETKIRWITPKELQPKPELWLNEALSLINEITL